MSPIVRQIQVLAKYIDFSAPAGAEHSMTDFTNNVSNMLRAAPLDSPAKQKLQLFVQDLAAAMPKDTQFGSAPTPQTAEAFEKALNKGLASLSKEE
ncbi:MAG: hypothetical protein EOO61_20800 [Hymenobacter sp.]|nr:MAG: hypothetical protein EOO61_20800 [Hymenobacter sp.]